MNFLNAKHTDNTEDPTPTRLVPAAEPRPLPRFVIAFPNPSQPFVPYYRLEGSNDPWCKVPTDETGLYYDPLEDTEEFKAIRDTLHQQVDNELDQDLFIFGVCHFAWRIQKQILKERYGVNWHSLKELNPDCLFD